MTKIILYLCFNINDYRLGSDNSYFSKQIMFIAFKYN